MRIQINIKMGPKIFADTFCFMPPRAIVNFAIFFTAVSTEIRQGKEGDEAGRVREKGRRGAKRYGCELDRS